MADSMVMVAPVDLLSIIHQAAERPIPPQLFGVGEVATPELQAQMLELHLQRKQLMAATAQQLHKLQQHIHELHSAAACDGGSQHGPPAWQPAVEDASAAAHAARQTNCSGEGPPSTASSTQRHSAAEDGPTAVGRSGVPATEASSIAAGCATDAVASGTLRPLEQLHQPDAAAAAAADGTHLQNTQPGSSPQQDAEQEREHAADTQHIQPPPGSADMQPASAAAHADAAQQPELQQQPVLQLQRSPAEASDWVPAQSRAHRKSQQQRERTAAAATATGTEAVPVAASRAPPNPNRYAMLPEADSPSGPSSLLIPTAIPSSNAAASPSATAASAVSAPSGSTCLADAAVQTPRLPLLPTASAVISPTASSTSIAVTDADTAGASKPGAVAPSDTVDLSPPHPSTPRQPADGTAGSSADSEHGGGGAADRSPAGARAAAEGVAGAAKDDTLPAIQNGAGHCANVSAAGSSSAGADDDTASMSTPAASLTSASDDGNGTRAERQRQRQRAKQGRQRAAKRLEAERQQEEEALLAAAAKERAEGLAEQQRQQQQQEEGLLNESAALQASLKREQDAQDQKRRLAAGAGRQMPLFAVRPMLDGSRGSSSAGAFRFDFPVPAQVAE